MSDRLDESERQSICAWMKRHTPRRFPSGDSGEDASLIDYLKEKGHRAWRPGILSPKCAYFVDGRKMYRQSFIFLVNRYRAKDKLPLLGEGVAHGHR